jgi:4-amino-4-deoxy-L-arabinose transferase-like glycosyltransferase
LAAAVTAATPLVTVHARIFKEDIFLAPLVVLALAALVGLLQAPAPRRAVLLGVLIGLAAGAKYIGAVMLPFAVVAIVLIPTSEPPRRLTRALTVAGMAVAAFLIVELPALRYLTRFRHGMTFEFGHSLKGHDVPLSLNLTWGVFHLSQSLWPNLGLPLLALGLIALAARLIAPSERRMPLMLIANFAVFHEASALKPYPDFARYVLPACAAPCDSGIVAAIPALWISMRTNGAVEDPRAIIPPSSPPRARGWPPIATPTTIRPGSFSATVCGRRSRRPISWCRQT